MKIFIAGEPLLVAEYADVCADHGHSVSIHCEENTSVRVRLKHRDIASVKTPPKTTALALELTNCTLELKQKNVRLIDAALDAAVPLLCSTVTVTATECAGWLQKPRVLIGISAFPSLIAGKLVELSIPAHHTDAGLEEVRGFFESLEKEHALIDDRIGMVVPRILAQVINEAMHASSQQLAPPQVIDTAMKLGAEYPHGPLEWLDAISAPQVVAVLDALYRDTGDERYAAAPLLRKMAVAGEFWKKPRAEKPEK